VVVVTSDLVLEVTEETSLLLLLLTMLISDPFLIFEEMSVLLKSLMNVGGALSVDFVSLRDLSGSGSVS